MSAPGGREETLQILQQERFDVLVIGGGATGVGVCLDAASRGLRTALVEQGDFGCGTSSAATKLIHGGIRYLELALRHLDLGQLRLVTGALGERHVLRRLAPHLVRPLELVLPVTGLTQAAYYGAGLGAYEALAWRRQLGPLQYLRPAAMRARFGALRQRLGGWSFCEAQFDDARLALAIAQTAQVHGAVLANAISVTALLKDHGRVVGAEVQDMHGGGPPFVIQARCVINATGAAVDTIRRMDDPQCEPLVSASIGVHAVYKAPWMPADSGFVVPRTADGRVLFVLPWLGHMLVGTTDEPWPHGRPPVVEDHALDYLDEQVKPYFPIEELSPTAVWAGIRPLLRHDGQHRTALLSREHAIEASRGGLLTVAGGKWTTYRLMARDTVDRVLVMLGMAPVPCRTATLPLLGGEHFRAADGLALVGSGLEPDIAEHLHWTYGDRAEQVAALARSGFAPRLAPGYPYIEAEVLWATRHEWALSAEDCLYRRMRLGFIDQAATQVARPRVEALLQECGAAPVRVIQATSS
jgi:glycerol-3-phosphate dehydrogenase